MRFEIIKDCSWSDIHLPYRATPEAAGYDFECATDIEIPPHSIKLLPTGIKAYINSGWYLQLAVRSSTPKKKGLILANGIGIVDADYYNNPDNDGHIMFQVYNITDNVVKIEKGERIGQGVFIQYSVVDNEFDSYYQSQRTGGFGSTG